MTSGRGKRSPADSRDSFLPSRAILLAFLAFLSLSLSLLHLARAVRVSLSKRERETESYAIEGAAIRIRRNVKVSGALALARSEEA